MQGAFGENRDKHTLSREMIQTRCLTVTDQQESSEKAGQNVTHFRHG